MSIPVLHEMKQIFRAWVDRRNSAFLLEARYSAARQSGSTDQPVPAATAFASQVGSRDGGLIQGAFTDTVWTNSPTRGKCSSYASQADPPRRRLEGRVEAADATPIPLCRVRLVSGTQAANLAPLRAANDHLVRIQVPQETAPLPAFSTTISLHRVGLNAMHAYGSNHQQGGS
ncbi:hypothetical protein [Ensifer sp. YR511]|uniref:hypothetical protein n=1 Tax=Ensifer sp. YR511 TaxID=1855294 RepID=UPI000B7C8BCB|nr:hypothetical protein [Ensifer sp. YR511]